MASNNKVCMWVYITIGRKEVFLMNNINKVNNAGFWIGTSIFVLSSILLWESRSMVYYSKVSPGPGFLPTWISGILIVLSLIYTYRSLKTDIIPFSKVRPRGEGLTNIVYLVVSLIVFLVITPYTGFAISSILMLFIQFNRGYKWYWAFVISVVVTIAVYFIFTSMLQVRLPINRFGF